MKREIARALLTATAPESVRPFIRCEVQTEDDAFIKDMCAALGEALALIEKAPRTWHDIQILLCDEHAFVQDGAASCLLMPNPGTLAFCVAGVIVFPKKTLAGYPEHIKLAAALEELSHLLLNIADEGLASSVVCHLSRGRLALGEGGAYTLGKRGAEEKAQPAARANGAQPS